MSRTICALGLDVGSTTVKIAAVDAEGLLVWSFLEQADPCVEAQVKRILDLASHAGAGAHLPLVATGYGRKLVGQASRIITEISCHAQGIYRETGHGGTLVDIGGQDSKAIVISSHGEVVDFVMSDKCAAGTGRFLENTANRLKVPVEQMGKRSLATGEEVAISSTCTVFAESEVISLIAHGVPVDAILRGLHRSLVRRLVAMLRTIGVLPPLMLSGGVAWNPAICRMLEEETCERVLPSRSPQMVGAYGAALIAMDSGG
jgi:predicted CoA-substrate-specific enzyme activase